MAPLLLCHVHHSHYNLVEFPAYYVRAHYAACVSTYVLLERSICCASSYDKANVWMLVWSCYNILLLARSLCQISQSLLSLIPRVLNHICSSIIREVGSPHHKRLALVATSSDLVQADCRKDASVRDICACRDNTICDEMIDCLGESVWLWTCGQFRCKPECKLDLQNALPAWCRMMYHLWMSISQRLFQVKLILQVFRSWTVQTT